MTGFLGRILQFLQARVGGLIERLRQGGKSGEPDRSPLRHCVFQDGDVYTGDCLNGLPHGYGTLITASGSSFTGQWRNGRMNGHGTFHNPGHERYVGEWRDDRQHGSGMLIFSDDERFEGHWVNGKAHGMGTYHRTSGETEQITFREGKIVDRMSEDQVGVFGSAEPDSITYH